MFRTSIKVIIPMRPDHFFYNGLNRGHVFRSVDGQVNSATVSAEFKIRNLKIFRILIVELCHMFKIFIVRHPIKSLREAAGFDDFHGLAAWKGPRHDVGHEVAGAIHTKEALLENDLSRTLAARTALGLAARCGPAALAAIAA